MILKQQHAAVRVAVAGALRHDSDMSEYKQPKLEGQRVPLKVRLTPSQHRLAWTAQQRHGGMTYAEYIGALIERDAGLPNALDDKRGQEPLDIRAS